jgi:EAL domain-containing protein (putative c-di-GMP-specific phosphodiesterase class I)
VLEITESIIMDEAEGVLEKLHALRALVIRLAIDDFGTGYSSLAYIQSLPIDILKIDRKFVSSLSHADKQGSEASGSLIVSSMIALARGLSLTTIAEGVETEQEAELLRQLGADIAQGFHFSRPLTANDASQKVLAHRAGVAIEASAAHGLLSCWPASTWVQVLAPGKVRPRRELEGAGADQSSYTDPIFKATALSAW